MFSKSSLLVFIVVGILISCANIVSPQGGEKDTKPPFAIGSNPKDSTVNFNAKKIIITFSENIQLKDAQKNINISPYIKGGLKTEAYKNKLTLSLKGLSPNTTYTINANQSIADITEGNLLSNLKYVFSTGSYLDSLKISGKVIDALTLGPCKNSIACLYSNFTDSSIIQRDPDYFTPANERGEFELENLHPGLYTLVSIEDKNNNHRWEAGEGIGFMSDPFLADSIKGRIIIRQFKQPINRNYLISATSLTRGVYEFYFDTTLTGIPINQEDPSLDKRPPYYAVRTWSKCYNELNKTYIISSLNPKDTAHFNYQINDSIYHITVKESDKPRKLQPESFFFSFADNQPQSIGFLNTLDSSRTRPGSIKVLKDTTIFSSANVTVDSHFGITVSNVPKGLYKLSVSKGALADISGLENDSFGVTLNVFDEADLQTLTLKIDSFTSPYFQLRVVGDNNTFCVSDNVISGKTYTYSLFPGKYRVFLYKAEKPNLLFTTGNFFHHRQPQQILYYKEIEIKKLFDLEESLHIMYY